VKPNNPPALLAGGLKIGGFKAALWENENNPGNINQQQSHSASLREHTGRRVYAFDR
jgi:hypothetical protein